MFMSQGNMKSGFKATGIYPFNPLIIPDETFAPSAATELPPPEPATDEQDVAEQMPSEKSKPASRRKRPRRIPIGAKHKPSRKTDDFNRGRGKTKKKETLIPAVSLYCTVCGKDEVKDMRCCAVCGEYINEECVGL
ncbi:hypothetical protein PR048_020003, partial [Dryococelus australis]